MHILLPAYLVHENVCCGYSLKVPQQGGSTPSKECPQHVFIEKQEDINICVEKKKHLIWNYECSNAKHAGKILQLTTF